MNTQGMTGRGSLASWTREALDTGFPEVKHPIYTIEEREELISIMIEAYKRLQDPDCPL